MEYTWIQIAWLFYIYSLIGWIAEVCMAALHRKKFVNRGFVNGPLCPIYGFASVLFTLFLPDLTARPFFLFLGGTVLATVLEYATGVIFHKIFRRKLWDYSNIRWNLDGYICVRYSLMWGVFAVLQMLFINPFLCMLTGLIPRFATQILLWIFGALLILDLVSTSMAVLGMQKKAASLAQFTEGLQKTSLIIENALTKKVQSRMMKSFPAIDLDTLILHKSEQINEADTPRVFAAGCCFYKLAALFFIGAFLGDITETIFCLITTGQLMSRSSVVYGPFSIVWGLGCAMLTALLYRYKDKSDRFLFLAGTILGGAYEYICSVVTEMVFGTVFWDYSGFTFNLGGRINLLYCFFWGIAAVVWFKGIYPVLSRLIEKLPVRFGSILCNCMVVFMIFNCLISALALARYSQRNTPGYQEKGSLSAACTAPGQSSSDEDASPDDTSLEDISLENIPLEDIPLETQSSSVVSRLNAFLDRHFDDARMARIYPNAKIVVDGVPEKIAGKGDSK